MKIMCTCYTKVKKAKYENEEPDEVVKSSKSSGNDMPANHLSGKEPKAHQS